MNLESRKRWDPVAAIAGAIALIMIGVYIGVIVQQGGQVAIWFVAGLSAAALLSIYSVNRAARWRRWALAVSGVAMTCLGYVGLASIGLPILCAGLLALFSAVRGSGDSGADDRKA